MSDSHWSHVYPWQSDLWDSLIKRHQQQGLPHALMLTGVEGIGKHALALETARWLLCTRRIEQHANVACGECHSCRLWQAGNHPDFMECQPEDDSRQIRIDGVRKLNEFLMQTPQISPCQVVSLHPVEVLNGNAANALLKTLEEPPGESFLLLETERLGSVMPTIRSRCQRLTLATPSPQQSLDWMQANGCDPLVAEQALRMNQMAPIAALAWVQQQRHEQHNHWLQQLQQWSNGSLPLDAMIAIWKKDELTGILSWLGQLSADLMRAHMGAEHSQLLEPAILGCFDASTLQPAKLIALHDRINSTLGQIQSGASYFNRQLLLESLMIEWQTLVTNPGRD
jgi:DNA polymerase-3 subunit delta'